MKQINERVQLRNDKAPRLKTDCPATEAANENIADREKLRKMLTDFLLFHQ